ncbi:MAG: nucleic acid-binding protein [Gammaproteobacteria bacterium]|nr:MAG: nucleic acid-binding protein [Gammaproteobacteria bacterium]RLA44748.1 MAG: nucleic acid-binding protein [Gammaproteobacteria bacterium]
MTEKTIPEKASLETSVSANPIPAKPQPRITPWAAPLWEACAQGKLSLPYCSQCEASFYYPRQWCPQCFNQDLSWLELSGRGKVYSFSVVHQSPLPSYQDDVPYVLAIIELEEGPRMMTNILNCDVDKVRVDMPVEVTFEERGDMTIPQFQPLK